MKQREQQENTKRIALLGVLAAEALVLSAVENLFPPLQGLPPGAKLGLSNIVTMFTAAALGLGGAVSVAAVKALFALAVRGLTAGLMSLSGGLLSAVVMVLLLKGRKPAFGMAGVSVLSAAAHNLGQLVVACLLTGTPALFWSYGPLLLLFAVGSGLLTGVLLRIAMPALLRESAHLGLSREKIDRR